MVLHYSWTSEASSIFCKSGMLPHEVSISGDHAVRPRSALRLLQASFFQCTL